MADSLTILDLPRRRAWLERGMGAKVRDLFGRDRARPLPTVEFVTPGEARARRLPATSWYRFDEERIGIYLETLPDPAREWERLEHHTLHELLHWTWNFSGSLSGAVDRVDHMLSNILADAANEQRAGFENPWARAVVTRGRRLLVADLLSPARPDDALWEAALLTLRAHSLLAARGWAVLDAVACRDDPEAAAAVWSRIRGEITAPGPSITPVWDRAFAIAWMGWRSANQFDLLDAVRAFRELFEEPKAAEPPPSPFGLDSHEGDAPQGEPQDAPVQGRPTGSDGTAPVCVPDLEDSEAPGDGPGVASELEALSENAGVWRPVVPRLSTVVAETIAPRPGRDLLAMAQADGVELGRRIKASRAPKLRVRSERGRAVARVIAREPDASRPFRSRAVSEPELTPDVFVAVIVDTSSSMNERAKIVAARRAAMTVAVACETARAPYVIVTSRRALHVGGDGADLARTSVALSGMTGGAVDGLSTTLGPILEAVALRPEPIHVAIVLQDGEPCDPTTVGRVVERHRQQGAIVVAVGLDLTDGEAAGLRAVFGPTACLTTAAGLVRDLGIAVSAAIARSVRSAA